MKLPVKLHCPKDRKGRTASGYASSKKLDDLMTEYRAATDVAEKEVCALLLTARLLHTS